MFLYYQYIKSIFTKEGKYYYLVRIIDTDFEINIEIADFERNIKITGAAAFIAANVAAAVTKTYRNNNLSLNFFRFTQFLKKRYIWEITDQLKWYEEYIPEYQEIKSELLKYISLI